VPEGNVLGVYMVDIPRIEFLAQRRYRTNWSFVGDTT
jgi:hypothetical protein